MPCAVLTVCMFFFSVFYRGTPAQPNLCRQCWTRDRATRTWAYQVGWRYSHLKSNSLIFWSSLTLVWSSYPEANSELKVMCNRAVPFPSGLTFAVNDQWDCVPGLEGSRIFILVHKLNHATESLLFFVMIVCVFLCNSIAEHLLRTSPVTRPICSLQRVTNKDSTKSISGTFGPV